ncbi:hypothetical protein [Allorhizobium taibaishanense]|uniref:Uncharacterized protein n=1 Tax=Allorhizobium taibaishanense TaxID=887144 RepID=A0A1Q9A2L6_9HYPH|nr:hypothetical protein [Allorhizobium taibaishanense]MBB4005806.1 hypothetical protein [Allorhizobium taibaishanense]OLP48855.1 hypothetical protein BJF91_17115 [Allorhizobium taibaishanense]
MGVVRQLIQIAATEALLGRTIAEDRVKDSLIMALPLIMDDAPAPIIAVSVEDSLSPSTGDGLFRTDVSLTLQLQMAVAKSVTVAVQDEDGGSGNVSMLEIGTTDAALEASLNLLDRQWRLALSDPDNAWAEILRDLIAGFGRISDVRMVDPESGRKHAARIIEVTLEPIAEPALGQDVPPAIAAGLDKMAASTDYVDLSRIFTASLYAGADLAKWQDVQAMLGVTQPVPGLIGVGTPDNGKEVLTSAVSLNIAGEIEAPEA